MKKRMLKAIRDLNAYIDDDRQKLCDELHEIKLSHNRKVKLLKQILNWLKDKKVDYYAENVEYELKIKNKIEQELSYPYKRCNWGYTHKQEPGHYCE